MNSLFLMRSGLVNYFAKELWIDGLLKQGALEYKNRPLWYDVYKAFPPQIDPSYNRTMPKDNVKDILYNEDVYRISFLLCNSLHEKHPEKSAEEILLLALSTKNV